MRGRMVGLALAALVALPAASQVNNEKYAGFLLVGQFGEICTMCEAVVLCEAGEAVPTRQEIPAEQSFTLYHLHTRTFFSQVSTIWEWFIANFSTTALAAGHTRPVTIHVVENGAWSAPVEAEMRVALEPARLTTTDGTEIDRASRSWSKTSTGQALGHCERMPLWTSLDTIRAHSGAGERP